MAILIIDLFEPIEIDEMHPHGRSSRLGEGELFVEVRDGRAPVRQTSQLVAVGEHSQSVRQQLARGDVHVEEHRTGAVRNRCGCSLEEKPTIFCRRRARVLQIDTAALTAKHLAQATSYLRSADHSIDRGTVAHRDVVHPDPGGRRIALVQIRKQSPSLIRLEG